MDVEISVAVTFVCSHLYHNLPRRRVDMFAEELTVGLKAKFSGHWYPETPFKGSAYRCTRLTTVDGHLDPVMERAACASGLLLDELVCALPRELTIWVDPGEVAQRVGERGYMTTLYSNRQARSSLRADADSFTGSVSRSQADDLSAWPAIASLISPAISPSTSGLPMMTPAASFVPDDVIDSQKLSPMSELPSSGTSPHAWSPSRLSPVHTSSPKQHQVSQHHVVMPQQSAPVSMPILCAPSAGPSPQRSNSQTMTAALFAQTKFGSTKLRSQARRPTRLLPAASDHLFAITPATGAFQPPAIHLHLPSQQSGSGHTSPRSRSPHGQQQMTGGVLGATSPESSCSYLSPTSSENYMSPRTLSSPLSQSTWSTADSVVQSSPAASVTWPFAPIGCNRTTTDASYLHGVLDSIYGNMTSSAQNGRVATNAYDAVALSNGLQQLVMSG